MSFHCKISKIQVIYALHEHFCKIWAHELLIFRFIGLATAAYVGFSAPQMYDLLSADGVFGYESFLTHYEKIFSVSLDFLRTSDFFSSIINGASLLIIPMLSLSSTLMLLGKLPSVRWAAVMGALAISLLHFRLPLIGNSSDILLGQLMLCCFFMAQRSSKGSAALLENPFFLCFFCVYLANVYTVSVFFKLQSPFWSTNGSALELTLNTQDLLSSWGSNFILFARNFFGETQFVYLLRLITRATLLIEVICPFLIAFTHFSYAHFSFAKPSQNRISYYKTHFRLVYFASIFLMLALHAGIGLLLSIGPFPFVCLFAWSSLLFYFPEKLYNQFNRANLRKNTLQAVPFTIYLAAIIISSAVYLKIPNIVLQPASNAIMATLHLKQYWAMFASPPLQSTTYEIHVTDTNLQTVVIPLQPGSFSYAVRALTDDFWAGSLDEILQRETGYRLLLKACQDGSIFALPTPLPLPSKVALWAVQKPHHSDVQSKRFLALASCPLKE